MFVPNQNQKQNICVNMKKHTLDKIIATLETLSPEIEINEKLRLAAAIPLERMLECSVWYRNSIIIFINILNGGDISISLLDCGDIIILII